MAAKIYAMIFGLLTLGFAAAPTAQAARLAVQDPCSGQLWLDTTADVVVGKSVGSVTVSLFKQHALIFSGTEEGISSISGTVTGDAALEVMSEREMRAYGWCYRVNGCEPDKLPHQIFLEKEDDVIHWFFGFAHFRDGAWISYCTPTHVIKPPYICERT